MSLSPSQQGLKSTASVDELTEDSTTEDNGDCSVTSWLKNLSFSQYEHLFSLSGYDDTNFMVIAMLSYYYFN